jgi:malate dehydrogenase
VSFIAIVGAGPLGGALAHRLAGRDRVREVRLIDTEARVAEGKALDIRQSAPVEGFSTQVTSAGSIHAAAGADAIVLADAALGGIEHGGEPALSLVRRLAESSQGSPIVCAGAAQRDVMARSVTELRVPAAKIVGAAPFALESALRAVTGLIADGSGVEISLSVIGVPPDAAVVAWEEASAFGQPLTSAVAPHDIASLSARIPGLWPPGPYALASAAARVVEALVNGSRRRFSCFVALPDRRVAAMPVELERGGVKRVIEPTLTRQERTRLENALARG